MTGVHMVPAKVPDAHQVFRLGLLSRIPVLGLKPSLVPGMKARVVVRDAAGLVAN